MPRSNGDATLFDVAPSVPDGFVYHPNFLSQTEEQDLIRAIQQIELAPFQYYQFTGKRRTASFGWEYEFGHKDITPGSEIPSFLLPFRIRAGDLFDINQIGRA